METQWESQKVILKNVYAYISVIRCSLDYGAVTLGYYLFVLRHRFRSLWLNRAEIIDLDSSDLMVLFLWAVTSSVNTRSTSCCAFNHELFFFSKLFISHHCYNICFICLMIYLLIHFIVYISVYAVLDVFWESLPVLECNQCFVPCCKLSVFTLNNGSHDCRPWQSHTYSSSVTGLVRCFKLFLVTM